MCPHVLDISLDSPYFSCHVVNDLSSAASSTSTTSTNNVHNIDLGIDFANIQNYYCSSMYL